MKFPRFGLGLMASLAFCLLMPMLMVAGCAALNEKAAIAVEVGQRATALKVDLLPPSPAAAADRTVLDEKAAIAVEVAWRAAGALVETATDAGLIRGATALKVEQLDATAERAVKAVRSAYDAGNAADYATALAGANSTIDQLTALIRGSGRPQPAMGGQ